MSFKAYIGAFFALLFFVWAPQAHAKVTNADVLDGVNEWRAAYATANRLDAAEILVYERQISIDPPTTLMVCGKSHTFTKGDIVWNVCRKHLEEQAAAAATPKTETHPAPSPIGTTASGDVADHEKYEKESLDEKSGRMSEVLAYTLITLVAFALFIFWLYRQSKKSAQRYEAKRVLRGSHREYPLVSPFKDSSPQASRPPPE
ncbi:MAG TPA: hypothetical protein VGE53_00600 [Candidatus Paceibacterota bacterium]